MSQQSRRLFEAMSDLPDEMIDQVPQQARQKKPGRWKKWAALAACLAIVVGLGTWLLPRMGGSAGGEGSDGATTFMSYAGPVFPLTLKEENSAITAQRSVTLDFTPWIPEWWSNEAEAASRNWVTEEERQKVLEQYNEWFPEGGYYRSSTDILVTDAYTLANATGEDQTVTLLYPFAAPLQEVVQRQPTLTVDGTAVEPQLVVGAYSGSFMGAIGAQEEGGSVNLDYADNWEDYQALLSDGSYLSNALGEAPDVSGISVIVYEFVDA